MRGLSLGPYQTGQLAWLNHMQLQRLRLALSGHEAGPREESSDVNNGGVGGSPKSSSLQTCSRCNALALIALHLGKAFTGPFVFLAGCYNVTHSLLSLATVSIRGCETEEAMTAGILKRTHSIYFTGFSALRATVVS